MLILISRSSVDPTSIIHSFFIPNILSDFFFVLTGTNRYFSKVAAANMGIEISMVDASDLSKLKAAIKPKTKVKKIFSAAFSANYYNYMLHTTDEY